MKHTKIESKELSYSPCRYGGSRLLFRGPRKRLDLPYLAFVGGTQTYGKFIEKPFPTLVERAMRQTCVNFGCVNGGIDAFVNDSAVMKICANAELTVLEVMGANNLSNRFYSVQQRRGDRFLRASTVLQAIYPDVDFGEFSYTQDMLVTLHTTSPDRFETVVAELREAWVARMRTLLQLLGERVVLLWFSLAEMSDVHWSAHAGKLEVDPLFVTAGMIDQLRPLVKDVVVVNPSEEAIAQGTDGMFFPPKQTEVAAGLLGPECHAEGARALIPSIRETLYSI